AQPAGASPALEGLARCIDPTRVLRREIHPALAGASSRRREMAADKASHGGDLRQFLRHVAYRRVSGVRNHVRTLKNVGGHQQVARADSPPLCLERSAHARGAREGVVHRPDLDLLLLQRAKDEWQEPGFVSDIPHDAKRARFLASPSDTNYDLTTGRSERASALPLRFSG